MNENKMPKLMTAKEYAKYVQADVRTVRRWMRNGLLEFTPPPKKHPHYARLIDSRQPRPKKRKKKGAESTNTAKPKVKSTANVPRQVDKQPANVPRQVDKQPANIPRQVDKQPANIPRQVDKQPANVARQADKRTANVARQVDKRTANVPRQVDKRPANIVSQQNEKIADQDDGQSVIFLLAIAAFAKPVYDLIQWLFKKIQQQRKSSLPTQTIRQNTQKYTSLGELFDRQDKK